MSAIYPKTEFFYYTKGMPFLNNLTADELNYFVSRLVYKKPLMRFMANKKLTKFSMLGLFSFIGYPTHHSKILAFQTPATPIMEGIIDLHNDIMFFLVFIIFFVFYLLIICMIFFSNNNDISRYGYAGDNNTHNTFIEVI